MALPYRGRFAPSPTGSLHRGSLIAAVASFLEAKTRGGAWLVRMEDLDPPREVKGAADDILRTLERYGFEWDESVIYQSQRLDRYQDIANELLKNRLAYFCQCTRKDLENVQRSNSVGVIYPGYCRTRHLPPNSNMAIRVITKSGKIEFVDIVQGPQACDMERESGDYIIRRADGFFAYQLAVVVDDQEQGITDIVRGSDLLDVTPRQIDLQQKLGYRTPTYMHVPVATNREGEKWSKQTYAKPLSPDRAADEWVRALAFLGQSPPNELSGSLLSSVIAWALANWNASRIPRVRQIMQENAGD